MDEISVESVPSRKGEGKARREGVTGPLHKNNPILIGLWPKILKMSNPVISNLGEVRNKRCILPPRSLHALTNTHVLWWSYQRLLEELATISQHYYMHNKIQRYWGRAGWRKRGEQWALHYSNLGFLSSQPYEYLFLPLSTMMFQLGDSVSMCGEEGGRWKYLSPLVGVGGVCLKPPRDIFLLYLEIFCSFLTGTTWRKQVSKIIYLPCVRNLHFLWKLYILILTYKIKTFLRMGSSVWGRITRDSSEAYIQGPYSAV